MNSVLSELTQILVAAPARAGQTKVIAVDGRSGAGKSTLGRQLRDELNAELITMDYLYGGWDGLSRGVDLLVSEVLNPLAASQIAKVPHYDWINECWGAPRELAPPEFLVVEGVGAGAQRAASYVSVLVWLSANTNTRKKRGLDRASAYELHWDYWAAEEDKMYEEDRPWERADLVLSTEPESVE